MSDLVEHDLSTTDELWREYEWTADGERHSYRIMSPMKLFYREGGTTHRVVDVTGIVHLVPAPGEKGCVIRWTKPEGRNPVDF